MDETKWRTGFMALALALLLVSGLVGGLMLISGRNSRTPQAQLPGGSALSNRPARQVDEELVRPETRRSAASLQPAVSQPAQPSGDVGGWSHKELIEHLRKNGLQFRAFQDTAARNKPSMYFVQEGVETDAIMVDTNWLLGREGIVRVAKESSSQAAKDTAGTLGARGFSWGPFLFSGRQEFLSRIQRALR